MLGAAPTGGAEALVPLDLVNLGGLGRRNRCRPARRLRLDVRQRILLVDQIVSRAAGGTRLIRVLVGDPGGGSEFAWISDWRQVIFGVDQACRGGASRGWLRDFAWALPMSVMRLTGHPCQGKGI